MQRGGHFGHVKNYVEIKSALLLAGQQLPAHAIVCFVQGSRNVLACSPQAWQATSLAALSIRTDFDGKLFRDFLKMDPVSFSETLVSDYESIRRYNQNTSDFTAVRTLTLTKIALFRFIFRASFGRLIQLKRNIDVRLECMKFHDSSNAALKAKLSACELVFE